MSYEYKVLGKVVKLDLDPNVVAVRFQSPVPNSSRSLALEAAGVGPLSRRFEIAGENLVIVPARPSGPGPAAIPSAEEAESALESLNARPEVEQALPVYQRQAAHAGGIPSSTRRSRRYNSSVFDAFAAFEEAWRARLPRKHGDLWDWCVDAKEHDLLALLAQRVAMSVNAVQMHATTASRCYSKIALILSVAM